MSETMVNGDSQQSHFIAHLTSYPVVSDGITTYKSNPYGEKSIALFNDAYSRFASPFIPYLQGPYSWVAPYVAKADELGDSGLSTIDDKFPIVKEDTEKIKGSVFETMYYPVQVAQDGKEYVFKTYEDEGSKIDGKGIFHLAKTVVSTELRIASDVLHALAEWLGPKKEKAQKTVEEKIEAMKN
ncbi:putative pathogenesis associated protein Cap20 [Rhizodiscina lignyota]|uniref:Pathogenesis associated protein Cap20 n=1 Tax=Rhizodiscina lignyota TaxID=1504668 RepID=A0A9P4IKZ8_9PEZI|nr:putative pathogenesis associated protein Cap20 [Rhizodiscina lignyota]